MAAPLVIAVDCSTTAAKAIVVDAEGRVVGSGSQALDTRSPVPHWFEQDATQWWTATDAAIRAALQDICGSQHCRGGLRDASTGELRLPRR
ncbi:FGGY family carbohydrate kinase [Mycobacterium kyogaense]|uniref:FGGY family carbohydrate kinase n=1 Tax=Mycobacterium kyogaense TaxID=2212479 RepID=UPI0013C42F03|nr:FGGY family carbohydrate kinase [Mycobacterium kyogaense]